jgi:hypothetical protein
LGAASCTWMVSLRGMWTLLCWFARGGFLCLSRLERLTVASEQGRIKAETESRRHALPMTPFV